jgi:membrane associated rhomboid family serine protease
MSFSSRSYVNQYIPSNRFPVGLKWLLISNIGIYVISVLLQASADASRIFEHFELIPAQVIQKFAVWELVTYLFLHASISHILWNMLALWMFGRELERLWGTYKFLRFYFICGISAGITVILAAYLFGGVTLPTVGSSGAIYGLLVAYAVIFPDQTILFGFLIPMKSKYFVMIIGGIVFLQSYLAAIGGARGSGVAVMAHLGGMVVGYLLLRGRRLKTRLQQPIESSYKDWKLRRAKKKFEVYLRKKDSDRDRWVH